ncbi:MAG: hypothetical protein ACLQA5_22465 [Solirubrobacteraceae bacterium]
MCISGRRASDARSRHLPGEDLRDLLIAAFVAALLSAQEADPEIKLDLSL